MTAKLPASDDTRRPLLELKLIGRVGFHPFELGRERLRLALEEICDPLHVEIKNHLSLVTRGGEEEDVKRSLAEIERDVLRELISASSDYKGRKDELVSLALAIRDQVHEGRGGGGRTAGPARPGGIAMQILSIHLKNIKSHRDTELSFSAGINVLSGPNGVGKSTVFEAIGYALFGVDARGLRLQCRAVPLHWRQAG